MGTVSGFVFQADNEPTVYSVGDSVRCNTIKKNIQAFKPDIIITHSGGATIPGFEPIIMDVQQTLNVLNESSGGDVVVAIHMEALDHCGIRREELRKTADSNNFAPTRLMIPNDVETISF